MASVRSLSSKIRGVGHRPSLSFRVKGSVKGATARLKKKKAAIQPSMVRRMHQATSYVEADLKSKSLTGSKGYSSFWGVTGASGDSLGVRSGHLRRSIVSRVFTRGPHHVIGTVGTPLAIGRMHERGGTIHGKPWLRLPTRIMQTAAGVDKLAGKSARALGDKARVIKSRAGNPWIVEVGTARSKLAQEIQGFPLMLYMLVHSVKVRARHPFRASLTRTKGTVRGFFSGFGKFLLTKVR